MIIGQCFLVTAVQVQAIGGAVVALHLVDDEVRNSMECSGRGEAEKHQIEPGAAVPVARDFGAAGAVGRSSSMETGGRLRG